MSKELPAIDFLGLIISYATSTLISLGAVADPSTGQTQKADLAGAQHTIDVLALLEEKTRGNLSEEEGKLLTKLLFDCRMAYVTAKKRLGDG